MYNMHLPSWSSFAGVCALLRLRDVEVAQEVQEVLHASTPLPYSSRERTYLAAWASCCEEGWEEAATVLLAEEVPGALVYRERAHAATIRRKRPWVLWLLGKLATALQCLEASEHYRRALSFLDERRMDDAWLRIQVLADQAACLALQGDRAGARVSYHQALRLCSGPSAEHGALASIYAGLCELLCTSSEEQVLMQAQVYGMSALGRISPAQKADVLCHMAEATERLGQDDEALTSYQSALQLAEGRDKQMAIRTALARISLKTHDLAAAQGYCDPALEEPVEEVPPGIQTALYLVCAQVAHQQNHAEDAVSWCRKALAVSPNHAETLSVLAHVLEELITQEGPLAQTAFWREAYALLTRRA